MQVPCTTEYKQCTKHVVSPRARWSNPHAHEHFKSARTTKKLRLGLMIGLQKIGEGQLAQWFVSKHVVPSIRLSLAQCDHNIRQPTIVCKSDLYLSFDVPVEPLFAMDVRWRS